MKIKVLLVLLLAVSISIVGCDDSDVGTSIGYVTVQSTTPEEKSVISTFDDLTFNVGYIISENYKSSGTYWMDISVLMEDGWYISVPGKTYLNSASGVVSISKTEAIDSIIYPSSSPVTPYHLTCDLKQVLETEGTSTIWRLLHREYVIFNSE